MRLSQPVTFTAAAHGCSPADYRFILLNQDTKEWMITQGWGPSPTWTWETGKANGGLYSIVADARARDESGDGPDVSTSMPIAVAGQCTAVSLTASQSPIDAGLPVTLTAIASGCLAAQYRFTWFALPGGISTTVQDWGANVLVWDTTGLPPGRYTVQADARAFVNNQAPDTSARIDIDIFPGAASGAR